MKKPNWRQNLLRRGGFWKNGRWYDLHLERRMPLVVPMLDELASALPPLEPGAAICDLGCGTGNAGFTVLAAYPLVRLTLLDEDPELLHIASEKIGDFARDYETLQATIKLDGEPIPGGPYNVIVASLSLHAIAGHEAEGAEAESRYELLFHSIREGLLPGGHLFVADHVGTLGLFRQMKAMERAGFSDVDCAWRQDDFFVAGGRIAE